jgi:hypothetical protein
MMRIGRAMSNFSTTVELSVEVEFEYDPGEAMVAYYADGSGHPGSPPSVEIGRVMCGGVDITEVLSDKELRDLEELILEDWDPAEEGGPEI